MKEFNEHLISNLPNRWYTHLGLRWLRRRMKKANSRYEIHVRYRTPKRGKKSPRFGDLKREDARKLSVYIRERASVKEARLKQERDARWREEYIEDRIKRGIEKALEEMELK